MDDALWNHGVFSKNLDRLLNSEVAQHFFAEVKCEAKKKFMSDDSNREHFRIRVWE